MHPLSKVVRYLISVAFATSDRLCRAVTLRVTVHTASQIKPDSGLMTSHREASRNLATPIGVNLYSFAFGVIIDGSGPREISSAITQIELFLLLFSSS